MGSRGRSSSIAGRIGRSVVVLVTVLVAVTAVGVGALLAVTEDADDAVDQARQESIPLLQLAEQANAVAWAVRNIDPDTLDLSVADAAKAQVDRQIVVLTAQGFRNPEATAHFNEGARTWTAVERVMVEARGLLLDGQDDQPRLDADGTRIYQLIEQAIADFHAANDVALRDLEAASAEAESERDDAVRLSIALAVLGMAIVLVVGLRLTRQVVRPTKRLRAATSRIAAGDPEPVAVEGPTELAELAEDFNTMARELRSREATLIYRALHDPLTSYGNRTMLHDRLAHALDRRRRRPAAHVSVLVLDLDGFKNLNDSLGHATGDEALKEVGDRLAACLRDEDSLARLGGDEFGVVVEDDAGADVLAERLCEALRVPLDIADRSVRLTASIGIASTRDGGDSVDELLRDADLAMYAAKHRGGDAVCRFTPEMHHQAAERLQMEEDLRHGIEAGELEVHFQPVVDLRTGTVPMMEALVRWRHPTQGLLSPDRFVYLADETGLVVPMGWEVLRIAAVEAGTWPDDGAGYPIALAVNVSPRQLAEPDVVDRMLAIVAEAGLAPDRLVLELTETTMLEQIVTAAAELRRLRDAGVRIALDDFGTGYTSLRYLHGTEVDLLKIDRAFVDGVATGTDQRRLVRTIVDLADDLGFEVVAEGVEAQADLDALVDLGCSLVQGFALARPCPAADVPGVLERLRLSPVSP